MSATSKTTGQDMPGDWPWFLDPAVGLRSGLENFEKNEWRSADEWESAQRAMCLGVLEWAVARAPYYAPLADILKEIRTQPGNFWNLWRQLPLLTKQQLRSDGATMEVQQLPEFQPRLGASHSSGSTGAPARVAFGRAQPLLFAIATMREHLWHKRDFSQRHGFIRYLKKNLRRSTATHHDNWGPPVSKLYESGPAQVIHTAFPLEQLADWLLSFDPSYLLAYPSVMDGLLDLLESRGTRPVNLREVRFMSEPVQQQTTERLQGDWGVKSTDMYSCNELGYIALQCPVSGYLHVQSEYLCVEVLDPQGQPCAWW